MPNIHCPSKAFGIGNYRVGPYHQPEIYPHDYAMTLYFVWGDPPTVGPLRFARGPGWGSTPFPRTGIAVIGRKIIPARLAWHANGFGLIYNSAGWNAD